jgi:hypothetical protein
VIEVAEELVETVRSRQMLVAIAEVVLAELAGGITVCLKNVCDAGIMRPETKFCTRQTDLGEAGANRRLSGDESSAASGAALLAIPVSKNGAAP